MAEELKCEIKVIQGAELEAQGFGGLWGVGKASEHLPALVILSYRPTNTSLSKDGSEAQVNGVLFLLVPVGQQLTVLFHYPLFSFSVLPATVGLYGGEGHCV